tara:strand:- start:72 stop:1088 length:1017 start_codon:yes stop_codon:yes gene_type:complete
MSLIIKDTNFSKVAGALSNLTGTHCIQNIVDTILQISNFKSKTLKNIDTAGDIYGPFDPKRHIKLENLFVDMDYQRPIRLRKIINKITNAGGFDKYAAGHIDVAYRGDRGFDWDGLRRAIMAGICGAKWIPVSVFIHKRGESEKRMKEIEAKMFKVRNADSETMKPEEIFKSKVVYREPKALALLDVLIDSKLDVEGLNPHGKPLGGFKILESELDKKVKEDYIVSASNLIQEIWSDEPNVSVYLLVGLAKFLELNEELDNAKSDDELEDDFYDYVNKDKDKKIKQTGFTSSRLNSKPIESVAYFIAKNVVKLNGNKDKFIGMLKLSDDEIDNIEDLN